MDPPSILPPGSSQGGRAWLRARNFRVTGTRACALMGASKWTSREAALHKLAHPEPPIPVTWQMRRGTQCEGVLRDHVARTFGLDTLREVPMFVWPGHRGFAASPDGIADLPGGGRLLLEIKVVSSPGGVAARLPLYEALADSSAPLPDPEGWIPAEHWHQVNFTAMCAGATEILYVVLHWSYNGTFILHARFPPDQALQARQVEAGMEALRETGLAGYWESAAAGTGPRAS
jgi:hypothetical protein